MRRTTSLLLAGALALGPNLARAQDEDDSRPYRASKAPKASKASKAEKAEKAEQEADEAESEEERDSGEVMDNVPTFLTSFPPHRYSYIVGGAFLVGGLAFAFSAQGEARRSDTITSAVETQNARVNARASAAMASVMLSLAAATLIYAFILEFLPEPVAEKASLTFHF
jgi:hypothetical protein